MKRLSQFAISALLIACSSGTAFPLTPRTSSDPPGLAKAEPARGVPLRSAGRPAALALAPIPAPASDGSNAITVSDYLQRLESLKGLVTSCRQAMSPAACSSDEVGPDVMLQCPAGPRSIHFGWLRRLLDQAAHPDASPEANKEQSRRDAVARGAVPDLKQLPSKSSPEPGKGSSGKPTPNPSVPAPEDVIGIPATPNIFKQLDSARKRLDQDQQWAGALATGAESTNLAGTPSSKNDAPEQEHRKLATILAGREYHAATSGATIKDRVLEKIANWINRVIGGLIRAGSKSKWIGQTAEIGFVLALSVALIWLLIRLERQGRLGAASFRPEDGSRSASARDWQLWLEDARQAAAKEQWREAIHYLYWASISRLESSGMWPADRARTPREYLALLSKESAQRPSLAALTQSFERTWYAGRAAGRIEFQEAQGSAASLGAELNIATSASGQGRL